MCRRTELTAGALEKLPVRCPAAQQPAARAEGARASEVAARNVPLCGAHPRPFLPAWRSQGKGRDGPEVRPDDILVPALLPPALPLEEGREDRREDVEGAHGTEHVSAHSDGREV